MVVGSRKIMMRVWCVVCSVVWVLLGLGGGLTESLGSDVMVLLCVPTCVVNVCV